ncbi:hypothetical protein BC938DRAFT_484258 [Jimgerdemannia flammicorona]|uniref:F-box domain-containing protein n=1 Tax=Jimgerdemannia flammicorona TaxID=994334 RepID=A0A433QA66_9FUNG|nr:hypothetical protein BC938DRAFT_484258 [Jimgerdemannia flammicorona]
MVLKKRLKRSTEKTPPRTSQAAPLPILPPEVIIHILAFLPWQRLLRLYCGLPTDFVDSALRRSMLNEHHQPYILLAADGERIYGTAGRNQDNRRAFPYAGFDTQARIVWFARPPTESDDDYWYVDTSHLRRSLDRDVMLDNTHFFSMWSIFSEKRHVVIENEELRERVRALNGGKPLTSDQLKQKPKPEEVRFCGVDYVVEGYISRLVPQPDTTYYRFANERWYLDSSSEDSLSNAPSSSSSSCSPVSQILEPFELDSPHRPRPKRRHVHRDPLPPSESDFQSCCLVVDRIGTTFTKFMEMFADRSDGHAKIRDPCAVTTLFPRRIGRLRDMIETTRASNLLKRLVDRKRERLMSRTSGCACAKHMVEEALRVGCTDTMVEERVLWKAFGRELSRGDWEGLDRATRKWKREQRELQGLWIGLEKWWGIGSDWPWPFSCTCFGGREDF